MTPTARMAEIGITLPTPAQPAFNYDAVVLVDGVAYVSGQLPKVDGAVKLFGKAGADVSLDEARAEARICALQGLASLQAALGSLDRVTRIAKVSGFVASASGFNDQPKVLDAASDLFCEVFGERGRHARSAVGVAELPRNASVEIEFIAHYSL